MSNYYVLALSGKQYLAEPGKSFEVDFLGEELKSIEAQVLLISDGKNVEIGTPYLKDTLKLDVIAQTRGEKIRVAKFHAKANYRRVRGHKSKLTQVMIPVKKT